MDTLDVDDAEGTKAKPNNRLARRARSFKEDLLEKLNNMKTPHVIRSHSPAKRSGKSPKHRRRDLSPDHRASPSRDFTAICREVELSLKYYQDVVQKGILEMLPGSTTAVLETVVHLLMVLMNRLGGETSPVAASSTQQLNQALAELVSWSNNVLLFGLTPGQTATEVVNGVRNAVTTLRQLAGDGAGDLARHSRTVDRAERRSRAAVHRNSLPDLSGDKPAIVHCGPHYSLSNDSVLETGEPPPNPPLPGRPASLSDAPADAAPPPLPPKRRSKKQSSPPPPATSTPARAQLSKRGSWDESGGRPPSLGHGSAAQRRNNSVGGGAGKPWSASKSPDTLSPASSLDSMLNQSQEEFPPWNKHGSYSSIGNSSGSSTRDSRLEVDSTTSDSSFSNLGLDQYGNWVPAAAAGRRPDINAITRQLRELSAAADPASSRPESGFVSLQSLQSSGSAAGRPPAAASPQASPRPPAAAAAAAAAGGGPAGADACDSGGGEHTVTLSVPPALPPKRRSQRGPPLGHYDNVPSGGVSASCSLDGVVLRHRRRWHDTDDSRPPPLPMKKKHVQSYMEMIGDYCQPSQAEFLRQSAMVHRSYAARWSRNEFAAARSCTVAEHLRSSSDESGESETFEHTPLVEELSPPALPPKRRSGSMSRQFSPPPQPSPAPSPQPQPSPSAGATHTVLPA